MQIHGEDNSFETHHKLKPDSLLLYVNYRRQENYFLQFSSIKVPYKGK